MPGVQSEQPSFRERRPVLDADDTILVTEEQRRAALRKWFRDMMEPRSCPDCGRFVAPVETKLAQETVVFLCPGCTYEFGGIVR